MATVYALFVCSLANGTCYNMNFTVDGTPLTQAQCQEAARRSNGGDAPAPGSGIEYRCMQMDVPTWQAVPSR
jgi:hypothetical protein